MFKVQESHIELNKIFLDENKLINLSKSSGGSFTKWEDRDNIISMIKNVNKSESFVSLFPFRYNYFYISFIIILLSIEWFFRKKHGLI